MNETGVLGSWGGGQECLCQRGCGKPVQVVGTESTHSERPGVHGNPPLEQHGGLPASLGQASGGGGLSHWEVSFLPAAAPSHAISRKGLGPYCSLARQHPSPPRLLGGGSGGRKWAEPRPWQDPSERV